jgi:hypothetical protein
MIRDENAPWYKQAAQEGQFLASQMEPIASSSFRRAKNEGQGIVGQVAAVAGLNLAPAWADRTAAQNQMHDYLQNRGHRVLTPDEAQKQREYSNLKAALRAKTATPADVRKALERGIITPTQATKIQKDAGLNPLEQRFRQLTLPEAEHVYGIAGAEEQALWKPALDMKRAQGRLINAQSQASTPESRAAIAKAKAEIEELKRRQRMRKAS